MAGVLDGRLVRGNSGIVNVIIDGNVEEMGVLVSIEANLDMKTTTYMALGVQGEQTNDAGFSGSGSMTLRYGTRMAHKVLTIYKNTGKMPKIEILGVNDDPSFNNGKIKVLMKNVTFTKLPLFKLDVNVEILEESFDFNFGDWEALE